MGTEFIKNNQTEEQLLEAFMEKIKNGEKIEAGDSILFLNTSK